MRLQEQSGTLDLFGHVPPPPQFDGKTYDKDLDYARLDTQMGRVFRAMKDGRWRTLADLQERASGSEAGVSARLRDMRKPKFGGLNIERRRRGPACDGLWEYRLVPS